MKITCPSCYIQIPGEQVNVTTDVAFCTPCEQVISVSDVLASGRDLEGCDLAKPPQGVHFEETYDGWKLVTSTRSWAALFTVPFACLWSGMLLGGLYTGEFDQPLLGIPFLLASLFIGAMAVMTVCGKIVVSTNYDQGKVFTGVGPIGWTQTFSWASVAKIRKRSYVTCDGYAHSSGWLVEIVGEKSTRIHFGLGADRRLYLLNALRSLLNARSNTSARYKNPYFR